jgi:hypothetical protein
MWSSSAVSIGYKSVTRDMSWKIDRYSCWDDQEIPGVLAYLFIIYLTMLPVTLTTQSNNTVQYSTRQSVTMFTKTCHWKAVRINFNSQLHNLSLLFLIRIYSGTRGSVVGWGTMLQAGRSRVRFQVRSLDFLIDLILPAALWPCGRLSL